MAEQQVRVPLVHSLHGGVYTRTARIRAGMLVTGVLIKVPTTLVARGEWAMLQGGEWVHFSGLQVLPAEPGRRAVIKTFTDLDLTMVLKSAAKSVEEAERGMTDEHEMLQSRDGVPDIVINTHKDQPCQASPQEPPPC
jgi:hypothetical protein